MNEERLKTIDRLTNLLRDSANPDAWRPEDTWRSVLEAAIPGEDDLVDEVIENARFARDESGDDDNLGTVLISGFEEQDPVRIGRYEIQGRLGQGGMGVVYRAVFQAETFSDLRALKIIKPPPPGIDPELYRKRFKAEGEALGLLDHPNIVRIRDDGSEAGRPYLVMDLVPGAKHFDDYCDDNSLPLRQRLKLFHTLCLAGPFCAFKRSISSSRRH